MRGFLLLLVSVVALSGCSRHPTDAQLLAHFAAHRSEYEALTRKFEAAGVWRFGDPVAPHFIEGYDSDLKSLGILHASVWLSSKLLLYHSMEAYSIKGVAYWPKQSRSPVVASLDAVDKHKPDVYFRDIDEDWCLFLYVED